MTRAKAPGAKPPAPHKPNVSKQFVIDQRIMPLLTRINNLCKVHQIGYLFVMQAQADEVLPSWHVPPDAAPDNYLWDLVLRVNDELGDDEGGSDDAS